MQLAVAVIAGICGVVVTALLSRRQSLDLGEIPNWDDTRATRAAEDTVRWFGRPGEHARSMAPWAATTRDLERMADQAAVAEREERLAQMSRGKFRMVG